QVDQPRAGQFRVEHRGLDVRGRTQTDVQAVGARGEGQVDVDADQVAQGALRVRHGPRPVVRLLEQLLAGASDVETRQILQQRMPVRGLARCAVHRVAAQAARV